jgi:hypothetical protein
MESMVESVLHHRSCVEKEKAKKMEGSKIGWREGKQILRSGRMRKSLDDSCEVSTIYGRWMDRLKAKKSKNINVLDATLSQWTHKKAAKSNNIEKIQAPRFENWEARLLHRFSQASVKQLGEMNRTSKIR